MVDKSNVEDREIVVPGELLAQGMTFLPSGKSFRDGDKIYASTIGLVNVKGRVIKVIPLAGRYMPKVGDSVVGKIINTGHMGWGVEINCPYNADLNIGDATSSYVDINRTPLNTIYDFGDYIVAGVHKIVEGKFIKLTMRDRQYHRLHGGNIINVSPSKIPRIIGKQGSMISMIKDLTKCEIVVGQNGIVWIGGSDPEKILKATNAILKIDKESHTEGLTDKIKGMLGGEK